MVGYLMSSPSEHAGELVADSAGQADETAARLEATALMADEDHE